MVTCRTPRRSLDRPDVDGPVPCRRCLTEASKEATAVVVRVLLQGCGRPSTSPGQDISDRPEPESVVPALLALIDAPPASGRYRARDLQANADPTNAGTVPTEVPR